MKPMILTLSVLFAACGGSAAPVHSSADEAAGGSPQVSRGAALYGDHCAKCHGPGGQGTRKAPAVVGEGALPLHPRTGAKRDVDFHSAGDVLRWVRKAMPGDDPGSLSDAEYAAILAFALQANGVDMSGVTLDQTAADGVTLHP